ncbi:MAG: hypothetical protein OXC63_06530 [Aestuariivita sp.]|nr:hypothetical protein [Aestuariivita sp.]MCY4348117.1 hypothetical protein [Aestuariivita sp.]
MSDPFIVHTPEQLSPENIAAIFVEMYTDFPKLKEPTNMFIHGPRGSGKSIMLRSLESKVQRLINNGQQSGLDFFAVHVPIKDNFFGNPEYRRLTGWKSTTVAEHLLSVYVMCHLCRSLAEEDYELTRDALGRFIEQWEDCGGTSQVGNLNEVTSFSKLAEFFDRETTRVRQYYVRLPDKSDPDIYSGALTSFSDFLLPLCKLSISKEEFLFGKPFCFMLDDADNLPEAFQKVLNSWISTRTGKTAIFKVSTQLGYKTFRTIDNRIIESPHDFSEVNIGTVYTSSKANFAKRIRAIVEKRLSNAGIDVDPDTFFPSHAAQEKRRTEIRQKLKAGKTESFINLDGSGPTRKSDLAQRYATPALFRELQSGKSSHTYSYAGMQSLTDLSAGVVRWFLEPAGRMFERELSKTGSRPKSISVGVQDEVITNWSREFREKLDLNPGVGQEENSEASLQSFGHTTEDYQTLSNLLDSIGRWCRQRLLDETASEQRVFSFTLSDQPSPQSQLLKILGLAVRLGYLQKADLASKSATGGRRPRYILSRRLGPHYKLDVSGYAAHLSVTCDSLQVAMHNPETFINQRTLQSSEDPPQQSFDFGTTE